MSLVFSSWKVWFIKLFSLEKPRWQVGELDHKTNTSLTFLRGLVFTGRSYTIIPVDNDVIFLSLWLKESGYDGRSPLKNKTPFIEQYRTAVEFKGLFKRSIAATLHVASLSQCLRYLPLSLLKGTVLEEQSMGF